MTIQHFIDPAQQHIHSLQRRAFQLGYVHENERPAMPTTACIVSLWQQDQACLLPGLLNIETAQDDITQAQQLMESVLHNEELSPSLDVSPYLARLGKNLPLVASSMEEHDEQGIEKVYFDAIDPDQPDDALAEDLWCKASWLSFHDDDASLRFRFSFGMEALQDVAADPLRQYWAGRLCDALFPESTVLTQNKVLGHILQELLDGEAAFVERIVYFNAPDGGAQMHHDVERGHDGVVFAQLSGSTFWLALNKARLIDELINFCTDPAHATDIVSVLSNKVDRIDLQALLTTRSIISDYMEENDHELLEAIMDRCPAFIAHLCKQGFAYILHPGDVLLMPQRDLDHCVWHSVCCLGEEPGEALSFAIRSL